MDEEPRACREVIKTRAGRMKLSRRVISKKADTRKRRKPADACIFAEIREKAWSGLQSNKTTESGNRYLEKKDSRNRDPCH